MTPIALPSREILLNRLEYYPYTGALLWKPVDEIIMPGKGVAQRWNKLYANMEAFISIDGEGYLPAGHTMNCEPTRYLDIAEIARLLGQQGILVTIEEVEN